MMKRAERPATEGGAQVPEQLSLARLRLLRGMFLVNFVFLGFAVWPKLIGLHRAYEPLPAVAFAFWAALAALSGLGLRYPLAMVPLLLLQFFYKVLWLLAVWLPLQFAGSAADMSVGRLDLFVLMSGGAVMDVVVIPWRYVVSRFVRAPGERWSEQTPSPEGSSPRTSSRPLSPLSSSAKQPAKT